MSNGNHAPLSDQLAELQSRIKADAANVKLRIHLFQLLCVMGNWTRALAQLQVHPFEIEPDLMQQMPFTREPRRLTGGRLARDDDAESQGRWALPGEKSGIAWHLDDQHSGLASARRGLIERVIAG